MTVVRFLKGYRAYNSGETAGFDADTAAALLSAGIAVALDPVEPELVHAKPNKRGG